MYIPTTSGYSPQQVNFDLFRIHFIIHVKPEQNSEKTQLCLILQPINEFDFFNNHHQIDAKNNVNQFANQVSSPNPQTPSSIPDIILTGLKD